MKLYGHEIDRDELLAKLNEACRCAYRHPDREYRVTMNVQTGDLDVEEWLVGDRGMLRLWMSLYEYCYPDFHVLDDWYFNEPFEMHKECEDDYNAYAESAEENGEVPYSFVGWLVHEREDLYDKYLEEAIEELVSEYDFDDDILYIEKDSDRFTERHPDEDPREALKKYFH